ncbi:MAG: hypothetical protein V2A69_16055 [Pseudomonadota bacterium]
MPSSTWVHISKVCDLIWQYRQAKTVLDCGPGFGRWGFLVREILDVFRGRYDLWSVSISCVEIFELYIQDHHRAIYDEIIIRDALEFLRSQPKFDLIIAGDILEHFAKDAGKKFLDLAYKAAQMALIVCVPLGPDYPQKQTLGNKDEAHRAVWELKEFRLDSRHPQIYEFVEPIKNRPYAVILYTKGAKK